MVFWSPPIWDLHPRRRPIRGSPKAGRNRRMRAALSNTGSSKVCLAADVSNIFALFSIERSALFSKPDVLCSHRTRLEEQWRTRAVETEVIYTFRFTDRAEGNRPKTKCRSGIQPALLERELRFLFLRHSNLITPRNTIARSPFGYW